ncbi:hypothetical protein [Hymenobacter tenuis]
MRVIFLLLLWAAALSAFGQQQPHSIFLQVLAPRGVNALGEAFDGAPVRQLVADQLTRMGYRVVHDRQEFAQLAAQQYSDFIYADVLCIGPATTTPSVTLIIRDSLNNVWYRYSEDRIGLSMGIAGTSLTATKHLVRVLPATFTPRRFITSIDEQRGPHFLSYGKIEFSAFLEEALAQPELRRKIKPEGFRAELQIDSLGFASLQQVLLPTTLTQTETTFLQNLILASPRWRPAYTQGKRTATTLTFSWSRTK